METCCVKAARTGHVSVYDLNLPGKLHPSAEGLEKFSFPNRM